MIGFFMAIINHKRKIQRVCNFQRSGEMTLLMSIQFIFLFGELKIQVWLQRTDWRKLKLQYRGISPTVELF